MDNEGVWVQEALRGDELAFTRLIEAFQVPVYNLCYRMLGNATDADDAAQETFVRLHSRLGTYDPGQKLSTWVLSIASHHCIDRLRRQRLQWLSLDQLLVAPASEDPQPEESLITDETSTEVQAMLQSLPPDYRLIIVLRYWQDLSYEEIAQATGTTESAVKSKLHRARKVLAQQIVHRGTISVPQNVPLGDGKKVTRHAMS